MTMKKYFILAVAAIAVLSGCKKDNNGEAGSFTATIEQSGAKTTLGTNDRVEWNANGEHIIINGVTFDGSRDATNLTCATFTNNSANRCYPEGGYYKAYYPTTLYDNATNSYKLPAEQAYDVNTNGISNLPMYAQCSSSESNLTFHNLCAVLEITVNGSDIAQVDSIVVKSDKQLNGAFTASALGELIFSAGTPTAAEKKVKLNVSPAVTISSTGSEIFRIAIPAHSAHNLIVRVYNGSTCKVMATKNAGGLSIVRNHIYPITFVENAVQLWAGGPYFATCNLGATSPEGYGDYYAWGETSPKEWYGTMNYALMTIPSDLFNADGITLSSSYDAATQVWGSNWKMPTKADFDNLIGASHTMGNSGDVYGCTFSGSSGNSIFLPCAGWNRFQESLPEKNKAVSHVGTQGRYWSSTMETTDPLLYCYTLQFTSTSQYVSYINGAGVSGFSIRPVLSE